MGVVRAVVVLVLERVFVVGGEVVAATTRVLAGRGRDLFFFFSSPQRGRDLDSKTSK
jgi:hypothetical protein